MKKTHYRFLLRTEKKEFSFLFTYCLQLLKPTLLKTSPLPNLINFIISHTNTYDISCNRL